MRYSKNKYFFFFKIDNLEWLVKLLHNLQIHLNFYLKNNYLKILTFTFTITEVFNYSGIFNISV